MSETMDPESQALYKAYSHNNLWEIWQAGQAGEPLQDEQASLFKVMQEHPEQYPLWDRLNEASDEDIKQDGANMVLHITVHATVENQLSIDQPPAVAQVLKVLQQKGVSRHDAIHMIGGELFWEINQMMKEQRLFDETRYIRALRKLPLNIKDKPRSKKK